MYLEIVSPEATLFSSKVDSVAVPGVKGEFQMLKDHASIVSLLGKGNIKIYVHQQEGFAFDDLHHKILPDEADKNILTLAIASGTVEMKDNRVVVLAD
ncbi:MAG: F0F1 ATP synthase subunit epsilon [Bacteroidota bacterium]